MPYLGSAPAAAALSSSDIATDAIGASQIAANAVDSSEIAAGSVDIAHLSASGTAGSGNFLRGDNSWTAAGGDLSFGGDTFGANKVIGSNDTYSLSLETDGNTAMTISTAGEITKPLHPCVLVKPSSTQTNFAVGSFVDVVWGTEVFDIGGNFASNTFTAPVTGKYLASYSIRLENMDSACSYYYLGLTASNRSFYPLWSSNQFAGDVSYWSMNGSILIDMDASDTFKVTIVQQDGTQQSDIAPNTSSYLSIGLFA